MKGLYIVILLFISAVVSAQSRYTVYKIIGSPQIKKFRTEEWVDLKKNDDVVIVDIVSIPDNESLVVLDKTNRSLYKLEGPCEKSLKALIDEVVNKSDKITANLNKELLSKYRKRDTSDNTHTRLAAVFRGAEESVSFLDSMCTFIIDHAATIKIQEHLVCWKYGETLQSDNLKCSMVKVSTDEFFFKFSNMSAIDVFVNVVYVFDDGSCRLCYEFDYSSELPFILVPAGKEVSIPQYRFASSDTTGNYFMIASDRIYDTHALQVLLTKNAR